MFEWLDGFLPYNLKGRDRRHRGKLFLEAFANMLEEGEYVYPFCNRGTEVYAPEAMTVFGSSEDANHFANQIELTVQRARFLGQKFPLLTLVGREVKEGGQVGALVYFDFARANSILVSGATDSGKTRGIYAMMLSVMYTTHSDALKITVIDFKKDLYFFRHTCRYYDKFEDIGPTLLGLKREMAERQLAMQELGVPNIGEYNQKIVEQGVARPIMPYHLLVLDEVKDLYEDPDLQQAGKDLVEIARKGRSAGVCLILSTQRPDRDSLDPQAKSNAVNNLAFRSRDEVNAKVAGVDQSKEIKERGVAYFDHGVKGKYIKTPHISTELLHVALDKMRALGVRFG